MPGSADSIRAAQGRTVGALLPTPTVTEGGSEPEVFQAAPGDLKELHMNGERVRADAGPGAQDAPADAASQRSPVHIGRLQGRRGIGQPPGSPNLALDSDGPGLQGFGHSKPAGSAGLPMKRLTGSTPKAETMDRLFDDGQP